MNNRSVRRWLLAALVLVAVPALAVQPGHWLHNTEADFEPGKTDQTVVTNLGDVKLAMATKIIGQIPEEASVIYDLQPVPNGDVYIAAGPEAKLLRRHGEKIDEVLSLPGEQIFSLDVDARGRLLVAVSGAKSRLAVLDGDKLTTLIDLDGVRYIWDMLIDGKYVYLATGTEGKLLRVDLDRAAKEQAKLEKEAEKKAKEKDDKKAGKEADKNKGEKHRNRAVEEILSAKQPNLLCLGRDARGRIYAGTDTDGLIFRITFDNDGKVAERFVLYDAPEPEIGSLVVEPDGTVYAGTADADQARPGRLSEATSAQTGRPEVPEKGNGKPAAPAPGGPSKIPSVPPPAKPIGNHDKDNKQTHSGDDKGNDAKPANPGPDKDDADETPQAAPDAAPRHKPVNDAADSADESSVESLAAGGKPGESTDAPTQEQRDELRNVIRERLQAARRSGELEASPPIQRHPVRQRMVAGPGGKTAPSAAAANVAARKEGNAVYRITPDGFVTEVFRESVMILKMIDDDGSIVVATGNEGVVYRVDPVAGETTMLADLEPQQVPAMVKLPDGSILLGTANAATLVRLEAGFAQEGSYTSVTLDAAQVSLWGTLNITADIPEDTAIAVETRSGNVQDPDQAAWSSWSKAKVFKHDEDVQPLAPREMIVQSPPARFLQYRLRFTSDGKSTAVADKVSIYYVMPNLKPVITSVQANYPDSSPGGPGASGSPGPPRMARGPSPAASSAGGDNEPEPQTTMTIEWEASDPNGDQLRYKLEYQAAGTTEWLPLAKDLDQPTYEWQTRRVPDGRYIVRVTASDAPDNPPGMALTATRRSDPIVVDNTPPDFEDLKIKAEKGSVVITGNAHDALSIIRSIHYGVDSTEHWQPVLPDDLIYDSTTESFTIKISDLSPGPHMVTLRATDARSNARYQAVSVEAK